MAIIKTKLISLDGLEKIVELPEDTRDWFQTAMQPIAFTVYGNDQITVRKTHYRFEEYETVDEKYVVSKQVSFDREGPPKTVEEYILMPTRIAIFRQQWDQIVFEPQLKTLNDVRETMTVESPMDGLGD